MAGIHHVEVWVADLDAARADWGWLFVGSHRVRTARAVERRGRRTGSCLARFAPAGGTQGSTRVILPPPPPMSPRLSLTHQWLDAIAECDEFVHKALISVTTNEAEHRLRPTQRIQGGPQDQLGRLRLPEFIR